MTKADRNEEKERKTSGDNEEKENRIDLPLCLLLGGHSFAVIVCVYGKERACVCAMDKYKYCRKQMCSECQTMA